MKNKSNGYSLIEILIVLVICVFIVLLSVLAMFGYISKSERVVCESERGIILRSYKALKFNQYPSQNDSNLKQDILKEVIELSYQINPIEKTYPYQYEEICQQGGIYIGYLEEDNNLRIECSEHKNK